MSGNRTFTMIKPTAVRKGYSGAILDKVCEGGFRIVTIKMTKLTPEQAREFYKVHQGRSFYDDLCSFISSGPVIAAILEKPNAVKAYRDYIGATNPAEAAEGSIRKLYGTSLQENAVHGADSDENAFRESNFFFSELERY